MEQGVQETATVQSTAKKEEVVELSSNSAKHPIVELITTLVGAVIIAVGIRTIAYEPFNIPSESMLPTLQIGDYLFVSKYPYGYSRHSMPLSPPLFSGRIFESPVQRGDVAVFKVDTADDGLTDFIKRIVGLPGDRIKVTNGRLYVNNKPVVRERIEDYTFRERPYNPCRIDYRRMGEDGIAYCDYPQYRETLPNGVSFLTLDLNPYGDRDNTREYIVPQGHYFAMGDNRDNSADSRKPKPRGIGYISAEDLVGRAEIIFFSTDGRAKLWQPWYWIQAARGSRFFTLLR